MATAKESARADGEEAPQGKKPAGVIGALKSVYFAVEDGYYASLDFLDQNLKIPVYKYFVEPIEVNGVPSFPFAVLLIMLLAVGIAALLFTPQVGDITISLQAASGKQISLAKVTLSVEQLFSQTKETTNGSVTFSGVPLGHPATLTVVADNFKTYEEDLDKLEPGQTLKVVSLEDAATQATTYPFRITVNDEKGLMVSDAMIIAAYTDGTSIGTTATSAKGQATIVLPKKEMFTISVTKDGYQDITGYSIDPSSSNSDTVKLKAKGYACVESACPVPENYAIIFNVKNGAGDLVDSEVSFSTSSGHVYGPVRANYGTATLFVAKGTEGRYKVNPAGNDVDKYLMDSADDLQTIDTNNTQINVILSAKAPSNTGLMSITVNDETGKGAKASVSVYNQKTGVFVAKNDTKNGVASFSLPINKTYYATAYADGYFPSTTSDLTSSSRIAVTLEKIQDGASGSLKVLVLNTDGVTPVSGAKITLRDSNGRYTGYQPVTTDADGKAIMPNIKPAVSYRAVADYPPKMGASALFQAPEGSTASMTIKLDPTSATITVFTQDMISGASIEAKVYAVSNTGIVGSCQATKASLYACTLNVPAESQLYINVNQSGYEPFTAGSFVLDTNDDKQVIAQLLPSEFKDQFFVTYVGLDDLDGKNVTLLDLGKQYDAVFTVHFPEGQATSKGGMFVRVGAKDKGYSSALDPKEDFVIKQSGSYSQSSPKPIFSSTYNPSPSCSSDISNGYNDQDMYKWVAYPLENMVGSRTVNVRVFVKPTAARADELAIDYRGWLELSNSTYIRDPVDPDFGTKSRSSSKDWCYAATNEKAGYTVANGGTCSKNGCIILSFSDGTFDYGRYLSNSSVGVPILANIEATVFKATSSPHLVLSFPDKQALIRQYVVDTDAPQTVPGDAKASNVSIMLAPFPTTAKANITIVPVIPARPASFTVSLVDGTTEVVSATGYVTITGQGNMTIDLVPKNMTSGDTYDFEVHLHEASTGTPVQGATVALTEKVGAPFGGNPPAQIIGGSLDDPSQGYNGIYTFASLSPSSSGLFTATATQPDYLDISKDVGVNTSDLMDMTPRNLDVCGTDASIRMLNKVDLDATVVVTSNCTTLSAYQYSQTPYKDNEDPVWVDATANVTHSDFSQSDTFKIPGLRIAMYTVKPLDWGSTCTLSVHATARDGSSTFGTILYKNCDQSAASGFLNVTPSEVINDGVGRACNTAATYTIANNLTGTGTINVSLTGPGLSLTSSGDFDLSNKFYMELARGASTQIIVTPTKNNSVLALNIGAIDKVTGANANVVAKLYNCGGINDTTLPEILDYRPKGGIIFNDSVKFSILTDKASICYIDTLDISPSSMRYQFTQDTQLHEAIQTLASPDGELPVLTNNSSNTFYANCCNPAIRGGMCPDKKTNVQINFLLNTYGSGKAKIGEHCNSNADCESNMCGTDNTCKQGDYPVPPQPTVPGPTPIPSISPTPIPTCSPACSGTTPICNSTNSCVKCDGNFGNATAKAACPTDTPICDLVAGSCSKMGTFCDNTKNEPTSTPIPAPSKMPNGCDPAKEGTMCLADNTKCAECLPSDNDVTAGNNPTCMMLHTGDLTKVFCQADNTCGTSTAALPCNVGYDDTSCNFLYNLPCTNGISNTCAGVDHYNCIGTKWVFDKTASASNNPQACPKDNDCVNHACVPKSGSCPTANQCGGTDPGHCCSDMETCSSNICVPKSAVRTLTLTYDGNSLKLTNATGQEVTSQELWLSSISPIGGFVLKFDNKDIQSAVLAISADTNCVAVFDSAGTKLTLSGPSISTLKNAPGVVTNYSILLPDPPNLDNCNPIQYSKNADGTVNFLANPVTISFMVSGTARSNPINLAVNPKKIDTDKLTFGAGVLDTSFNSFMPFAKQTTPKFADFDTSGKLPKHLETVVFDNTVTLAQNTITVGSTPQVMSSMGGFVVDATGHIDATRGTPVKSLLSVPSAESLAFTDNAANHLWIKKQLNLALNEWNNYEAEATANGVSDALQSYYVGGAGSIHFHVTTMEGGTLRVLNATTSASAPITVDAVTDNTGTYEYPTDIMTKDNHVFLTYWPWLKTSFAYPGQKHFVAFDEAGATVNAYDSSKTLNPRSCPSDPGCANPDGITSDLFCNPASGILENNPYFCCNSKVSKGGKCVTGGTDASCVLSNSGLVMYIGSSNEKIGLRADQLKQWMEDGSAFDISSHKPIFLDGTGSCASGSDCYKCFNGPDCSTVTYPGKKNNDRLTPAEKDSCGFLNYLGQKIDNGFSPVALLVPSKKCFFLSYNDADPWGNGKVSCSQCHSELTDDSGNPDASSANIVASAYVDNGPVQMGVHDDSKQEFSKYCLNGVGSFAKSASTGFATGELILPGTCKSDLTGFGVHFDLLNIATGTGWVPGSPHNPLDIILYGLPIDPSVSMGKAKTEQALIDCWPDTTDSQYIVDKFNFVEGRPLSTTP